MLFAAARRVPALRRAVHSLRRPQSTATTITPSELDPELKLTTLPNGVRVASDFTSGHFVAAGVYVDAGSRYESERTSGAAHMTDRLAFKSTTNRSLEQMTGEIEQLGGQFITSSSRDSILYQASTYSHAFPSALSILADTVLNPRIEAEELDGQRDAALWEVGEVRKKPEMIIPELLHETAYQGNTLGNPLLCPEEQLRSMTLDTLRDYRKMWFRPDRLVVAAAGVAHDHLVELADRYFGHIKPASIPSPSLRPATSTALAYNAPAPSKSSSTPATPSSPPSPAPKDSFVYLAAAPARYTGGTLLLEKPDLEFTHIYVGYESLAINDGDIYAAATLQTLLGGGGSFSAGGPGKGMYSRLYTQVLNQYHAVDFCSAFHHCYLDSGLFGLSISVHPSFLSRTPALIAQQLDSVTRPMSNGIGEGELRRARNQLKSSLAMALESKMVQVEDLGRQVQAQGRKFSMREMAELIDRVTLTDVFRVANRMLRPSSSPILSDRTKSGRPTVVVQGQLEGLQDVTEALARRGLAGIP
ncbi:mitochondrial processing peptidase [Rhodotorula toruloides]|uniref:Mitochondrial processing peptidase n=1 Tax=Rhodotorula toruloides TaxID=5286 RepID=A0A511K8M8_RHOTO|nr:mitochondrial processing peptidase [Rhodotorula toruloides]